MGKGEKVGIRYIQLEFQMFKCLIIGSYKFVIEKRREFKVRYLDLCIDSRK